MVNTTNKVSLEETKKDEGGEKVEITKSELKGLLSRIENLERGERHERPKRTTEHLATVRFYKGKPITWFGNHREILDDNSNKMVGYMDIKVLDEEKAVKVNYLDFLNGVGEFQGNRIHVQIIKKTLNEVTSFLDSGGHIYQIDGPRAEFQAQNPDSAGIWGKKWQDKMVEMYQVTTSNEVEVKVLEGTLKGQSFVVPESCLNQ